MNDRINVDGEVYSSNDIRDLKRRIFTLTAERDAAIAAKDEAAKRATFLESEVRRYEHEHALDLERLKAERAKVASDEKWIANLAKDADDLQEQLTAMTAARDEACGWAEEYLHARNTVVTPEREERITALRAIGTTKRGGGDE